MLGRIALVGAVVSALLGASSLVSAQSLIYTDYTINKQISIPRYDPNSQNQVVAVTDTSYNTFHSPGSFSFGIDWVGDNDQVTFTGPGSLGLAAGFTIVPTTNNPGCVLTQFPLGQSGVMLNLTNPLCNYTVSWSAPFSGQLTITYSNASVGNSELIGVGFVNTQIVGDPQFVGLRGQSYQVHGIDGAVYNIISEKSTQVNSRFMFLTQGQCPVIDGVQADNCWSHPGSYLGEMSFQQIVDGKVHAALLTAGPAKSGFAAVQVDGKALKVGQTVTFGSFSVAFDSAYSVLLTTEHFEFDLSNSDLFINQALRSRIPLNKLQAHGLLGQTASSTTYPSALKYIQGSVDDYVIADNDLFGTDFVYNQFNL